VLVSPEELLAEKGKLMSTRRDRTAVVAEIAPLDPRIIAGEA
jgi:hypothetical protein